jgi:hypothetical protein
VFVQILACEVGFHPAPQVGLQQREELILTQNQLLGGFSL